jgi:hypothetical protein
MYTQEFFDDVEFTPIYMNSGIGGYEFWGFKGYDHGVNYIDELMWSESLYSAEENQAIYEYVRDNFDTIVKNQF